MILTVWLAVLLVLLFGISWIYSTPISKLLLQLLLPRALHAL